nr:FadR/GntR family transcriptional regulator [Aureimonas sp. ME7]
MGEFGVRQIRISDQVADYIVRLIRTEGLRSGDTLPSEAELARRFDVSRPAVREATNALAGRGIITVSTGRSPTVASMASSSFAGLVDHGLAIGQVGMLDVLHARRGIEGVTAQLAAANRSDAQALELATQVEVLVSARGRPEAFWQDDLRFHQLIAMAAGNPLLTSMLEGLSDVVSRSTRAGLALARDEPEWDEIVDVHVRTADAILAGEPERARAAMADHFTSAIQRFERAMAQDGDSE